MPSLFNIALASALALATNAAPAEQKVNAKQGFTIHQKVNPSFKANGAASLVKALTKYGAQGRASSILQTTTGSVTATPADAYDSEYLCQVTIGTTTTKTFNLDFDTGSSDLWVFSSLQPSSQTTGHNIYNTSAGASQISGSTWQISYGDGSGASGTVFQDTVNIGGATVTSQAVEAATSVSSAFVGDANDGLVGLAFSNINTVQPKSQTTFFDTAIAQGLPLKLFTSTLKYHAAGSFDFGKLDSTKYKGSITYTPVSSSQGFWTFQPTGYAVGSGAVVTPSASSYSLIGIADTGTTLMLVSPATTTAYYRQVKGATNSAAYGGWVFPCTSTLPSFTLVINGYKAVVPGTYINYAPVYSGAKTCFGGIQSNVDVGFSIYGDIFLKSQYVVYDKTQSTPRIGFAAQA